jgi:recF protein
LKVERLELKNFRNYVHQSVDFGEGINILFGENAQGKTNILEALYITATGKSQRTNNYHDLIRNGSDGFEISLKSMVREMDTRIDIRYFREKGKHVEINGIKRNRISDILGTLNMIFFSPETLDIVKGSPLQRRKFIDILLCQVSKSYLYSLQQYNKLIKNKSIALKKGRTDKKYDDIIPIWNENIAKHGGRIAYIRDRTIRRLDVFMKEEMASISDRKEESALIYRTYTDCPSGSDESYYVECLSRKLREGMAREKELGQCIYGPHRDDIVIMLNGMNSRQYCSQGQQRSLALALVLSELRWIDELKGDRPVLLLDDVMSELDMKRQEYLMTGLKGIQTIITTTDDKRLTRGEFRNANKYRVVSGTVTRVV